MIFNIVLMFRDFILFILLVSYWYVKGPWFSLNTVQVELITCTSFFHDLEDNAFFGPKS